MTKSPAIIGLIPARAGSVRVRNKNIRLLYGHPLIAYTIMAARESRIFKKIIVSTDSDYYAEISRYYGAEVPFLRPAEFATATSPDIEWITYTINMLQKQNVAFDCFSILRPTSPFRTAETIRRAWSEFLSETGVDSLRAVEKCTKHPGKMWVVRGKRMHPLLPLTPEQFPWHSSQFQALPTVYIQNASLEIAWRRVVDEMKTIAGEVVMPFITKGYEGFDVNLPYDWNLAEHLIQTGAVKLPDIDKKPFPVRKEEL